VPRLGIEPRTYQMAGRRANHWATPPPISNDYSKIRQLLCRDLLSKGYVEQSARGEGLTIISIIRLSIVPPLSTLRDPIDIQWIGNPPDSQRWIFIRQEQTGPIGLHSTLID